MFRLQTGMRGAFGKALGTVARVNIGQILLSVRSTDKHRDSVVESLRRSKFKFPGRQKIYVSKKWGFTKWDRDQYEEMRAEGRLRVSRIAKIAVFVELCSLYLGSVFVFSLPCRKI